MGQVGKLLLSVLKTINQVLIMLANQCLKEFFFAFIITVKGSQRLAQRFDDIPQGSVLVAFLQKLRLCRIGAARAAYFPDITLTGAAGYASPQLNELFRGTSGMWAFAGQVMQPIFAGGRIVAQNKAAKAQYEEMLAAYEQTVQNAFKEALDALNSNRINREMFEILLEQTKALRRGYELTKKQEDAGLIGTMELLDVERNLLQAEMNLASARQNELLALISLSKAFGGGWDEKCGFGPFEAQVESERAAWEEQKAQQRAAAEQQAQAEAAPNKEQSQAAPAEATEPAKAEETAADEPKK